MKKTGFTLVELLAVIAILAIILVIAIPSIRSSITSSYERAYELDLKSLEDAAKTYIQSKNIRVIEDTKITVMISAMIEEGIIKEVLDPETKTECEGYVIVSKIGNKFIYEPYLKCGTNYVSDDYNQIDNEKPVITIVGGNPTNTNIGQAYIDAGATAIDNLDGNITSEIQITSSVNVNIPGVYAITYIVFDNVGNSAEATRTVNVIDNASPVITFSPNGSTIYSRNKDVVIKTSDSGGLNSSSLKYVWSTSATQPSIDLFTSTYISNQAISTPTNLTGSYYLWAKATDKKGNQTIQKSNIFNLDNTKPVITVNGNSVINVGRGSVYSDAGAIVTDNADGTTTANIVATGTVNPSVIGTYSITYNAKDSSGNAANPVTRTINVIDLSAPVITLTGSNPTNINVNSTYSDAGATAIDDIDGNVTSRITVTGTINPSVIGTYHITYTVTDYSNNMSSSQRTVNVIDNIAPTVAFGTNGNATYAKTRSTTVTVSDAHTGVNTSGLKYLWNTSTTAPSEASFTTSFTNGGTNITPTGVTGGYYLWILAKDTSGNITIKRSNVFNLDNTKPSITVVGTTPLTINAGTTYSDAGSSSFDLHSGISGSVTSAGTVNPSVIGTYTITYNVSDNAGNAATTVIRTINVVDATAPTVAFGTNGNSTYAKTRSTTVTVSDMYGTVTASSLKYLWNTSTTAPSEASFTTSFANGGTNITPTGVTGSYYLWILAKDTSGNTTITRTNVFNLDNTKPVITLTGTSSVNVNKGSTYSDAGATANDNINGSISVTSSGSVNVNIVGTYIITYNASDSSGNTANPVTRSVNVIDVLAPVITILGSNPVTHQINTAYSDAGSTALDDVDGNVTSKIVTTSTVNPSVVGNYSVTYKVSDNKGNQASVSRTVYVRDTIAPTITTALAGTMIQNDPTFTSGTNNMSVYNNAGGGTVVHTRISMSTPTGSGYAMKIVTSGVATPGIGGFVQGVTSKPNGVYVHRIIAKIPVGYTIQRASNACGTGATHVWITSQVGTGNWEEYAYITTAGATGTFSSFGHVYLNGNAGTTTNPITWYVAYATVIDTTKWGTSNSVMISGSDAGTGISGYGINQSSTVAPAFTAVPATSTFGKGIDNITANGNYYIWVKDVSGNINKKVFTVSYVDTVKPTFTSVSVTNLKSDGYDIYIYGVADAGMGINRIQFPTWTDYNGQDDIQSNWSVNPIATGTNLGGGTWYYRVNTASHNNEGGIYNTHIYLYDNAGNYVATGANGVNVPYGIPPDSCFAFSAGTITGYTPSAICPTQLIIPSTISGVAVRVIASEAFATKGLTSVVIPSGVTTIGDYAFVNNQITSATIPSTVNSIGWGSFYKNRLTSITIPSGITKINSYSFQENLLTSITIPSSVTEISSLSFQSNQLANVTIPSSVTIIGYGAFSTNKLTNVAIPNSVTSIDRTAFSFNNITQGNATIDNFIGGMTVATDAFYNNGPSKTTSVTPSYLRVPVANYTTGQSVVLSGSPWRVIKDNGTTLTLLAENPIPVTIPFSNSANNLWDQSNLKLMLNSNFASISTRIINDGYGFVRLIKLDEYNYLKATVGLQSWLFSSTIGTWWTMTPSPLSSELLYGVLPNGTTTNTLYAPYSNVVRPVITIIEG